MESECNRRSFRRGAVIAVLVSLIGPLAGTGCSALLGAAAQVPVIGTGLASLVAFATGVRDSRAAKVTRDDMAEIARSLRRVEHGAADVRADLGTQKLVASAEVGRTEAKGDPLLCVNTGECYQYYGDALILCLDEDGALASTNFVSTRPDAQGRLDFIAEVYRQMPDDAWFYKDMRGAGDQARVFVCEGPGEAGVVRHPSGPSDAWLARFEQHDQSWLVMGGIAAPGPGYSESVAMLKAADDLASDVVGDHWGELQAAQMYVLMGYMRSKSSGTYLTPQYGPQDQDAHFVARHVLTLAIALARAS